ncbi:hypothetical protein ACX0G7_10175 [Flavitalea antarctica]
METIIQSIQTLSLLRLEKYSAKEIQERWNPKQTQRLLQTVRHQQAQQLSSWQKQSNNSSS